MLLYLYTSTNHLTLINTSSWRISFIIPLNLVLYFSWLPHSFPSISIFFLWLPYWFWFFLFSYVIIFFATESLCPRHEHALLHPIPKQNRKPSSPKSPLASPHSSVRSHNQTVTVYMVTPFPLFSFTLQLYPAWLWQHHQIKSASFMICNHALFLFLPWLLSSQGDTSIH